MRRPRFGFTLIELLVVIAIIAILAAILFPVFIRVREKGKQTACTSNLSQLDRALKMYGSDNNGRYPYAYEWNYPGKPTIPTTLGRYVRSARAFACPSDFGDIAYPAGPTNPPYSSPQRGGCSYGYPGVPVYLPETPGAYVDKPYLATLSIDNPVPPDDITNSGKYNQNHLWIWRLPLSKRPELFDHNCWHYFAGCSNHDRLTAKGFNNLVFCDGHVAPMQYQPYLVLLGIFEGPHPWKS